MAPRRPCRSVRDTPTLSARDPTVPWTPGCEVNDADTRGGRVRNGRRIADDRLRELGFTRIQYGSQDKDDTVVLLLSNWTVTKQSTRAGSKVEADALIVLTCTEEG